VDRRGLSKPQGASLLCAPQGELDNRRQVSWELFTPPPPRTHQRDVALPRRLNLTANTRPALAPERAAISHSLGVRGWRVQRRSEAISSPEIGSPIDAELQADSRTSWLVTAPTRSTIFLTSGAASTGTCRAEAWRLTSVLGSSLSTASSARARLHAHQRDSKTTRRAMPTNRVKPGHLSLSARRAAFCARRLGGRA